MNFPPSAVSLASTGGGGGSGTVTSVGLSSPAEFTVSGSPVSTAGTLTLTKASQAQNLVWASPDGSSGVPTFRSLLAGDLPTIPVAGGGTGAVTAAAARTALGLVIGTNVQAWSASLDAVASGSYTGSAAITTLGTIGTGTWQAGVIAGLYGGTGVANSGKTITLAGNLVTSGANSLTLTTTGATNVTLPTTGTLLTAAGQTVTSVTAANGLTLTTGTLAFSGASYSPVAGSSSIVTVGTLTSGSLGAGFTAVAIARGGTGQTTKAPAFDALSPMSASGDIIYGGASGTGTRLAKGSDGQVLTLASGIPSWAAGGGGSQTPWASAIDGGGFSLSNVNAITATSFAGDGSALTGVTATQVPGGTAGQIQYNVGGVSTGGDTSTTDGSGNITVTTLNATTGIKLNGSTGQIQYQSNTGPGATLMLGDTAVTTDGAGTFSGFVAAGFTSFGTGHHTVSISAPSSGVTIDYTFFLPPVSGSNGQYLLTTGSGATSWATINYSQLAGTPGNPFNQSLNTGDSPTFGISVTATNFIGGGGSLTGINYSQLAGTPGNPFDQLLNTTNSPTFSTLTLSALTVVASAVSGTDPATTAIGTLLTTVANYIGQGNALLTDAPEWLLVTTPSGALRKIPVYAP